MSFRIIADSCCDKTTEISSWDNITFVPLTLKIGDNYEILDDENFDPDDFCNKIKEIGVIPKTACPSPEAFAKAFDCEEDEIYAITITSNLSGTYNCALQGLQIYEEEHPNHGKKIHVFDSLATSGIESLAVEMVAQMKKDGKTFEEIVEKVTYHLTQSSGMYFYLENLDILKNNGRLFSVAANLIKKAKIKLLLKRSYKGVIEPVAPDFAANRIIAKIAKTVGEDVKDCDVSNNKVVISHVRTPERAQMLAKKVEALGKFKEIEIIKCGGLNTCYASDQSVLISYFKD